MNMKPNIIRDIDLKWLEKTADEISKGKTTLKKKCSEAKFYINHTIYITYPISENSLRRLFKHYEIAYKAKKGPKVKEIPESVEIKIVNYYLMLRCGETITYYSMKANKEKVTLYQVQKVFKEYRFYKFEKTLDDVKVRCTYLAKYTNQIWHADVHYLDKNKLYLYAIIDDRSRYIVGYGVIVEKTANECLKILQQAIQDYGPPAIFWTDNGGENTADIIRDYLRTIRIYPVYITPRNPEQNGKIEAWWKKLDDFISNETEISRYVEIYNTIKIHTSLEKDENGVFKRPADVYFDQSLKWQRDFPWTWFKDGKEVDFKVDLERKREFYD